MAQKIALVSHARDETDDRASAWALKRGFAVEWVCPYDGEPLPVLDASIAGAVVYGGKYDVNPKGAHPFLLDEARWIEQAMARDIPVLGLCLGAQIMADVLGAPVGPHAEGYAEYDYYRLIVSDEARGEIPDALMVLESHWHGWHGLPAGAVHLARTELYDHQAFRYGSKSYAFQFHPEASRKTMSVWAGRRGERAKLPGAHSLERQLADNEKYHAPLGTWFYRFLDQWVGAPGDVLAAE